MSKTTRISIDDLSSVAAQGIERALAARKVSGIEELNLEEISAVSGGLTAVALASQLQIGIPKIIWPGGPFINPILNTQIKGF